MARSGRQDFYTGRSGQLAAIAQFLRRGYNAVIPEVDVGEDAFIVKDDNGEITRLQVKSAIGQGTKSLWAEFFVSRKQLDRPRRPDLWYVFAAYHIGAWREFVVIRRDILNALHVVEGIGRVSKQKPDRVKFYFGFHADDVLCNGISLQRYRANWEPWPQIEH